MNWRGSFWERRYSAEPVLDEGAVLERLRYIVSHGVKEGLVRRCEEWPGLSCLPDLRGRPARQFSWFDWSERWKARSGKRVPGSVRPALCERRRPWSSVPCRSSRFSRRVRVASILEASAGGDASPGSQDHPRVLGPAGVLAQDPQHRPDRPKRTRRPWCHAASAQLRAQFKEQYLAFRAAFSVASPRWRNGDCRWYFPNTHSGQS